MGVDPDKIDTAWQACRGSESYHTWLGPALIQ